MSQWKKALADLEGPDADPEERHRLANVIRDEFEELERSLAASEALRGIKPPPVVNPAAPRVRNVVAWRRGTSFSVKAEPEDSSWLEELASDPPAAILVRPNAAGQKNLAPGREDREIAQAWGHGTRAGVFAIRTDPVAFEQAPAEALEAGIARMDPKPGDWILTGVRRRNVGGTTGRALIVTFSYLAMDRVLAAEAVREEPTGGSLITEDEEV